MLEAIENFNSNRPSDLANSVVLIDHPDVEASSQSLQQNQNEGGQISSLIGPDPRLEISEQLSQSAKSEDQVNL